MQRWTYGEWLNIVGVTENIRDASRLLPEETRIISVISILGTRVAFPRITVAATKAAILGYRQRTGRCRAR
jgi:NAD(P)-dependent dehydrogenase (short-subunit alcohol dehydrogenase family)